MLEWYRAGTDYHGLMEETEALIRSVARRLHQRGHLAYDGRKISLASPWPRLTVGDAFARYAANDPGPGAGTGPV